MSPHYGLLCSEKVIRKEETAPSHICGPVVCIYYVFYYVILINTNEMAADKAMSPWTLGRCNDHPCSGGHLL